MVRWLIDFKIRLLNIKLICRGRLSRDKKCRLVFCFIFVNWGYLGIGNIDGVFIRFCLVVFVVFNFLDKFLGVEF